MLRGKRAVLAAASVAVLIFAGLVFWWDSAGRDGANSTRTNRSPELSPGPAKRSGVSGPAMVTGTASYDLDPGLAAMAKELDDPAGTADHDIQIVGQILSEYRRAQDGNPIGDNQDITTALVGGPGVRGHFLPRSFNKIRNGELVDRWGTPYWFHPNSKDQMEIRSAGPDRSLFTADDIVQGASPPGLGATPEAGAAEP